MKKGCYLMVLAVFLPVSQYAVANPAELSTDREFTQFVSRMVEEHNFDEQYLSDIFSDVRILQYVIDAMSRPAEKKPWFEYRRIFLTSQRVDGGVEFWRQHADLLEKAWRKWGVPPEIVTAIIGVETLYGRHKGKIPVLDSLVTLGFRYPSRAAFFRSELEQYLLLTREQGVDPRTLKGSYAGAMGMPQFISSSYRNYAEDFDGDGRKDLWNNTADVIGSVAGYFSRHGWARGGAVATRAAVTGNDYRALVDAGIEPRAGVQELSAAGVVPGDWSGQECPCALIPLELEDGMEYWVAANNFYVITRYNHSALYAMAVFQLANRIRSAYLQSR